MYALFKESVPIPVRRAVAGAETLLRAVDKLPQPQLPLQEAE